MVKGMRTRCNGHLNAKCKVIGAFLSSKSQIINFPFPSSISFILGTMMAFIEFSRNQELAKKVKMFFALAPVTTVGYIKGAFRVLSNIGPELLVSSDFFVSC